MEKIVVIEQNVFHDNTLSERIYEINGKQILFLRTFVLRGFTNLKIVKYHQNPPNLSKYSLSKNYFLFHFRNIASLIITFDLPVFLKEFW